LLPALISPVLPPHTNFEGTLCHIGNERAEESKQEDESKEETLVKLGGGDFSDKSWSSAL